MKITVKISDIEIEVQHNETGLKTYNDGTTTDINNDLNSIKILLVEATNKAKELYNNRVEQLN